MSFIMRPSRFAGGLESFAVKSIEGSYCEDPRVWMLTSTKAVMVYQDDTNIWASILTIAADNTITNTSRVKIGSGYTYLAAVYSAVIGNTVFVTYNSISQSQYFYGVAFTVSGTSITQGSSTSLASTDIGAITVTAPMSSTHFLTTLKDDTNTDVSVYGGSLSGTSITIGGRFVASTTTAPNQHISSLTSSKAIVFFSHSGNTYMRVVALSGTTASSGGSTATLDSAAHDTSGSCGLSSTTALYAANNSKCYVVTESSGNLSVGTALTFGTMGSGGRGDVNVLKISETSAAIFFAGNTGPTVQLLKISGTSVTLDGSAIQVSSSSTDTTIDLLSTDRFITGFRTGATANAAVVIKT
tara:strand:- start:119 stop:1186 length:1068 start_codon:yes stop_codon:yes gene_type:complete